MYTAVYLPNSDRNMGSFVTEDEAIQFIVDNCICSMCKDEGWGSACAAEWVVVETEKYNECDNLGDVLDAAGFERVE